MPISPFDSGARAKLDRMLKFMRDTPETAAMYKNHIPIKLQKNRERSHLVNLCMKWSKGITLHEILSQDTDDYKREENIENIINILQNTVSYNVPLLMKN